MLHHPYAPDCRRELRLEAALPLTSAQLARDARARLTRPPGLQVHSLRPAVLQAKAGARGKGASPGAVPCHACRGCPC